jgi:cytochrome P450
VREIDGRVAAIIDALIGKMRGREEIDLVGDFSYPLPVIVICEIP